MKKQLRNVAMVLGSLLALSALPVSAHNGIKLRASMSGLEEVPPISTQAEGDFEGRIESDGSVSFKMSYEDLEGGVPLFAHIHFGPEKVNGGIMVFLCNNTAAGPQPRPCPAAPATVEGTITAADVIGPAGQGITAGQFDEFVRTLRNGNAYANLHTPTFPSGEIRGQIDDSRGRHRGHDH